MFKTVATTISTDAVTFDLSQHDQTIVTGRMEALSSRTCIYDGQKFCAVT
jgi:hypothetical protein